MNSCVDIEIKHLRSFVAVAEERNFTRAAERLHLAQPALSVHIRQLEERMGVQLVERTTRRVALTPAGEALLERSRALLDGVADAVQLARDAARLLGEGSPSLLNEAPVFLALNDACVDLGDLEEGRDAIARGIPRLVTRVEGLAGTPYARGFLTHLTPNAGLLAAAEAYGLVPAQLAAILAGG